VRNLGGMRKPLLSLVASALVLAGCSAAPASAPEIATLKSSDATTPSSSGTAPPGEAERPRQRLDMTPQDVDRLHEPWLQCIEDNGGRKTDEQAYAGAMAKCVSKQPLPPWEYDKNNPESMDFVHKMVLCLRGKGVRVVNEEAAGPDGDRNMLSFGGEENDSESVAKGLDLTPVCEKELAGGGRK
jgi:hypothetical protein